MLSTDKNVFVVLIWFLSLENIQCTVKEKFEEIYYKNDRHCQMFMWHPRNFCLIFFMDWSQIFRFKMCCSVLMLTSMFTLATKSIAKWSEISGHLEISASTSRHQHRHWRRHRHQHCKTVFFLAKFLFCFLKFLMKKTSMMKSFSSTLAHLPWSFSRCLELLFCRKPVSTCFWRKELHSRRYLRSFKNTHGWKLHFACL